GSDDPPPDDGWGPVIPPDPTSSRSALASVHPRRPDLAATERGLARLARTSPWRRAVLCADVRLPAGRRRTTVAPHR
ncbi:MAG: hypothetical protein AAGG08_13705, partial [Actinomycetota bacterium]